MKSRFEHRRVKRVGNSSKSMLLCPRLGSENSQMNCFCHPRGYPEARSHGSRCLNRISTDNHFCALGGELSSLRKYCLLQPATHAQDMLKAGSCWCLSAHTANQDSFRSSLKGFETLKVGSKRGLRRVFVVLLNARTRQSSGRRLTDVGQSASARRSWRIFATAWDCSAPGRVWIVIVPSHQEWFQPFGGDAPSRTPTVPTRLVKVSCAFHGEDG